MTKRAKNVKIEKPEAEKPTEAPPAEATAQEQTVAPSQPPETPKAQEPPPLTVEITVQASDPSYRGFFVCKKGTSVVHANTFDHMEELRSLIEQAPSTEMKDKLKAEFDRMDAANKFAGVPHNAEERQWRINKKMDAVRLQVRHARNQQTYKELEDLSLHRLADIVFGSLKPGEYDEDGHVVTLALKMLTDRGYTIEFRLLESNHPKVSRMFSPDALTTPAMNEDAKF